MTPALLALALLAAPSSCVEENLAHFYAGGKEVAPQIIGADDPCDDFGGAGTYTPKYHIWAYVNYNCPARVDLDAIDAALDALPPDYQEFFLRVQRIAIVDDPAMKRLCGEMEACLTWGGDGLFVSRRVAARPGGLEALWKEFYSVKEEE